MDIAAREQARKIMANHMAVSNEHQREAWMASGLVDAPSMDQILAQVNAVNDTGVVRVSAAQILWSRGFYDRVRFWSALRRLYGMGPAPAQTVVRSTVDELIGGKHVPPNFAAMQPTAGVPSGLPIGETLVKLGAASNEDVQQALAAQGEIDRRTGFRFRLGQLMRALNIITWGEFVQGMAIHHGIEIQDFDDVMERLTAYEAKPLKR